MNRVILFMSGLALPALIRAQGFDPDVNVVQSNWPDMAAGGGRLFFALLAGILLAYAFQWILTCISAATGITVMGKATRKMRRSYYSEDRDRHEDREERDERGERGTEWEKPAQKIQAGASLWVLVTLSISTFCAAWLAAEMIGFGGRTEAVVLGLTVWAGFMLSMMWLEASMLGALLGNLMGAFKNGLQAAAAPIKAAAGPLAEKASASAEEIAAKVREEFQARGGGEGLKEKLQSYVGKMDSRALDRSRIEAAADELFEDGEVRESVLRSGRTPARHKFQEIAAGRSDLSPEEQKLIAETLHQRWNRLVEFVRRDSSWSPGPAYAGSEAMEVRSEARGLETPEAAAERAALAGEASVRGDASSQKHSASPYATSQYAASPAGGTVTARAGRGDFAARLQAFKEFLHKADKHDLNPVRIEQEVETMIYHPEEGFASIERTGRGMRRDEMAQALRQRRDITLEEADSIADLIDAARARLLSRSEIREHRAQETTDKALARVHDFVYSLQRSPIDMEGFKSDFGTMLEDPKGGLERLKSRATGMDRNDLIEMFAARKGISHEEAEKMAEQAEQALKTAEENARKVEEETKRRLAIAKREAAEQAESTRKLASAAAWWLVAIAVVTGAAAALGGLTGAAS